MAIFNNNFELHVKVGDNRKSIKVMNATLPDNTKGSVGFAMNDNKGIHFHGVEM
jgi:hypothetical protein